MRSRELCTFGVRFGVTVAIAGFVLAACGDSGKGPSLAAIPATTTSLAVAAASSTTAPAATTTVASGPTTVITTTPAGTNLGTPRLSDRSAVTTAGLDTVLFGMTIAAAEKAAGTRLLPDPAFPSGAQCIVLKPEKGPDGVWFTVSKGTIERVDVRAPSNVKTRSGAGINSTDAQIQALFPGRITETDGTSGKVLTYTPVDPGNLPYRVIFETTGNAVTSYRAGRLPAVQASAPC